MDPRIQFWLMCLVCAMCLSCMVCGEEQGLMNYEFQPAEEETDCNISISHKSAEYLMVKFYQFDPDVAYITLKFPNNSIIQFNKEAIQPFRWIWTFEGKDRKLPFLEWDLDYAILSAGLLQEKTLPESWVEFDVQPPNCSITIGKRKSNLEIAYAFSNMINTYSNSVGLTYSNHYSDSKNHSWCFAAEIPGVKDTFQYQLGIYFILPIDFTQYNCCFSYHDFVKDEIYVNCTDHQINMKKGSTPLSPFWIIIIFCCAPILLLDFFSSSSGGKMEGNDGFMEHRNGYISLDDMDNNENINDEENLTSEYVYLTNHSPITLSSSIIEYIFESCFPCKHHPRIASRVRRFIFVLSCPILVYIQLVIYHSHMKETTVELIKHGAPINFLTMLGENMTSSELFVPYLGGPLLLIILFHVIGIFFVVLPENLETLIDDACPTTTGYDLVKRFSHMQIEEERGFGRLRLLMLARLCCILNPSFWFHVGCVCLAKSKRCPGYLKNRLPTLLYYFLFPLIVTIIFVVCFTLTFIFYFLYFGNPWICLCSPFKGLNFFYIKRRRYIFNSIFKSYAPCCMKIVMCLLVPLIWYFSYSMMIIIHHGVFFVTNVITYLFAASLVYPSVAFQYVFFVASLLHYFLKQTGKIRDDYFDLLSDIVRVLNVLETDPNHLRVVDNTLVVPNGQNGTIQKIQINGTTIKLSEEQLQTIRSSASNVNDRLIRYKNKVPGIPRELFRYVVRKHKPVFIAGLKAMFPIVLIGISIPQVIAFISYISHDSSHVTEVMSVVFIAFISFLPRILELAFSGSNKAVLKEIFQQQLETSILEYKLLVQT